MSWAKSEPLKQQLGFAYYCAACTVWQHACYYQFEPAMISVVPARNSVVVMRAFLVPIYICQLDHYRWALGRLTVRRALGGPGAVPFRHGPAYAHACAALLSAPSSRHGYVH